MAAPLLAVRAADSKKALDIRLLDLREITTFADYFIVASGANQRQIQAIADEVQLQLKQTGKLPLGVEGYDRAEWVLLDYGDFIVHIFSPAARAFYDLERLWRTAREIKVRATA